jgi:cysteinyl-tRNA synthetase
MIVFYNTLGRRLEEFKPINHRAVRMYTCGPTVWSYPHIGNYRTFVFEDLLRRYLKYRGFSVMQVMNLTDVDDRIIKESKEADLDLYDFTEKYAKAFFEDLDFLRIERAEAYPRATQHIPEMVRIIEELLKKGYAYRSEDGSIYFKISKFPNYGKLSGLDVSELKAGARVRQDDYSKDAAQDFALWKAWDENDGNVWWDTSLGRGRPGWHIECSAMSMKYLGEHFDIHTGGEDNIFPHHENEIAQSEAYTGKPFANYWLHAGHLLIRGEKMAKRLHNVVTIHDLRTRNVDGLSVRFLLLSGHYRAQLNFIEDESLEQSRLSVKRINDFVERLRDYVGSKSEFETVGESAPFREPQLVEKTRDEFVEALDRDLDTPKALAVVFEFINLANKKLDSGNISKQEADRLLEFMMKDFNAIFSVVKEEPMMDATELPGEIQSLLQQRAEARASKDWKRSDDLRRRLAQMGIEIQDTPGGQKWKRRASYAT